MRIATSDVVVELAGTTVVRGMTVAADEGKVLGLVGPNGCGKSTLLRTLYRAQRPHSGRVLLDGEDLWRLPRRQVARSIAVMTQEGSAEFDLDVIDVVMLGRLPHHGGLSADTPRDLELVHLSLERVGAGHLAARMFSGLSGGEKQRVLLARCLAQEPATLVLDEPTNHLDIAFQHELLSIVRSLGQTTVVALHDLNLATAYCDAVAVMGAGRLVAAGPPEEVLTPALIRDVFAVDADVLTHPRTGRSLLAFAPGPPSS